MLAAVLDTETTGTAEHDQVMEVAVVSVNPDRSERGRWSTLARPAVPCSFEARATHHISDAEVEDALPLGELLQQGWPGFDAMVGQVAVVAHFAEFDLRLLRQSGVELDNPVICTHRCAQHLWPDAPRHSNQVLRYWLGLDDKYGCLDMPGLPPHRALPDAVVTSRLLMEMMRLKTLQELVQMTAQPILHKLCRFGKHSGLEWAEVARRDPGYLRWILREGPKRTENGVEKGFDADMRHTASHYLGMGPLPQGSLGI